MQQVVVDHGSGNTANNAMARRLKICLVTQEFPPDTNWGGVGVQFDNFAQAAARAGHTVVVISRAERAAPAYQRRPSGVEVWRIGMPLHRRLLVGRTVDRMLHARAVTTKIRELDSRDRFDVIEASEANFDAEGLVTRPEYRDRTVICCHGGNLQGQSVEGPLARVHRLDFEWSCRREHEMLRRARTIVVSSHATKDVVLNHGVDPRRVHLVTLGIDTSRFRPPEKPSTAGDLNVGFVGRLQERKGLDFVWQVMETLGPAAGIRFHFKGAIHPATRTETLRRLKRYAEFAQYYEPGSNEEMPDFLRTLDVLLVPSRFENFGLTYSEAMATGLVVFAGRGGGGPEVVKDGVTGFIVDPDGPVNLVVERLRAVAANRSAFADMCRRAREQAVRRFSLDAAVSAKVALFASLRNGTATDRT